MIIFKRIKKIVLQFQFTYINLFNAKYSVIMFLFFILFSIYVL